jgi:hypothetical protein
MCMEIQSTSLACRHTQVNHHCISHTSILGKLCATSAVRASALLPFLPHRDGTFRLWNGLDLKHFRTMAMGSSWITDCIYMPSVRDGAKWEGEETKTS